MENPNLTTTIRHKNIVPDYEFELELPQNMNVGVAPLPLPAKTIEAAEYFSEVKPSFFKEAILETPLLAIGCGIALMGFVSAVSIFAYKNLQNDKHVQETLTSKTITSIKQTPPAQAIPATVQAVQAQQEQRLQENDVRSLRGEAPTITVVQPDPPVLPRVAMTEARTIERPSRPPQAVQAPEKIVQPPVAVAPKSEERRTPVVPTTSSEPKEKPRTIFKKQETASKNQPESTQSLF